MPKGLRLNPKHDERTRAKIQTSQIINRLTKHVKGEIEMSSSQVRAAEILLKKSLPDLATIQHSLAEDYSNHSPKDMAEHALYIRDQLMKHHRLSEN